MTTGLVICPQCEQRGAEPYQVRYEKGYKIIAFRCGWCGHDWTATAPGNLPPTSDWLEGRTDLKPTRS